MHPPLWASDKALLARKLVGRLPTPVMSIVPKQVSQALDYARPGHPHR